LAYIRLQSIPKKKEFFPLVLTNDGNGIFRGPEQKRPEDLLETFKNIPDGTCMRSRYRLNRGKVLVRSRQCR
jgi:hypothetical protein